MLEIRNLTAGYGKKTVLYGLTAAFAAGELTCILGPNGCGKSTLLKAAAGLIPHAEGEICLDGTPTSRWKRKELARRVAYLAQGQETPAMTVGQMVLHGRFPYAEYPRGYSARDRELAAAALEREGISHLADAPLHTLSGGMRQSAYIAMALVRDAQYVLLDEPTTYLDVAHQMELMRRLRGISAEGRGVVAVMHDLPLALTFADRVVVMTEGRVAAADTPREIAESGITEAVFGVSVGCADGAYFCRLKP